jgi:hypothetical protein
VTAEAVVSNPKGTFDEDRRNGLEVDEYELRFDGSFALHVRCMRLLLVQRESAESWLIVLC